MHIDKKIPSMTINEMLVVIIISTIVVGMAFSVLRMVQQHMWSIEKYISKNRTITSLEQSLWIDFNRYSSINYNSQKSTLFFKSELDSVTYRFDTELVVKNRDTFRLATKTKHLFFDGNRIESGKIDALKLILEKTPIEKSLFVYKRKDAHQFMN